MKLLIADDHTLFRDALVQYIERAQDDVKITVTKTFDEAYEVLKADQDFDLVLLDLRMPGMNGLDGFRTVRDEFGGIKTALMSGMAEPDDVKAAMDLGAVGYFPKTLSGKALVDAIKYVLDGHEFVPLEKTSKDIMPSYYSDTRRLNGATYTVNGESAGFSLTPREKEVLSHLAQGASNKEIANELGLQVVTIKLHVRGICRKLDANNRTQAALKATQLGLIAAHAHHAG